MRQSAYVLTFALLVGIPFGVQAAEKETQVVTYVSGQAERWQRLNQAFQSKHPSIEAKSIRGNYERTRNRVTTEALAGSHVVDVIHMDPFNGWLLVQRGLFQPYLSKEAAAFPDRFRDPRICWFAACKGFPILSRTTPTWCRRKRRRKITTTCSILGGKISWGWTRTNPNGLRLLIAIWGKDKATNFLRGLNKQAPSLRRGHTLLAQLNGAGEFAVAVNVFGYEVLIMKSQGAPIEPGLGLSGGGPPLIPGHSQARAPSQCRQALPRLCDLRRRTAVVGQLRRARAALRDQT